MVGGGADIARGQLSIAQARSIAHKQLAPSSLAPWIPNLRFCLPRPLLRL